MLGWLLSVLGAAMLIPVAVDLADGNQDWTGFLASAVITGFIGVSLVLTTRGMPLGRLEFFTVLVLFSRRFWVA